MVSISMYRQLICRNNGNITSRCGVLVSWLAAFPRCSYLGRLPRCSERSTTQTQFFFVRIFRTVEASL